MKKLLLFSAIAVFGLSNVNAQDPVTDGSNDQTGGYEKGDVTISGSLNYSTTSQGDADESSFGIMPSVGYFVSQNIQVGLRLGYMSEKEEFDGDDVADMSSFMVGAFARYYCMPENRFSPFAQFGVDYMSSEVGVTDAVKTDGFDVGLGLGADFHLNDKWVLTTAIGGISYSTSEADVDGADARNTFDIGLDLKNIWFGARYRF